MENNDRVNVQGTQTSTSEILQSIEEIKNKECNFFIPDYQRGFRWGREQVRQFIEDINTSSEGEINCIQPLVLKAEDDKYIVIDGQQRLTTIYIILLCMGDDPPYKLSYDLSYNKSNERQSFLEKLNDKYENIIDGKLEIKDIPDIDCYHMIMAFDEIVRYLHGVVGSARDDSNDEQVLSKAIYDTYKKSVSSDSISKIKKKLNKYTKFIWYKIKDDESETKVFTRMNIGKIQLTGTELIRALLLNRTYTQECDSRTAEQLQVQIANEWDLYENTLRNPEFYGFIGEGKGLIEDTIDTSRISVLFALVNERSVKKEIELYKIYQDLLHDAHKRSVEEIRKIWNKIRDLFSFLNDWYTDLELYHYVGCYVSIIQSTSKLNPLIELCNEWRTNIVYKEDFLKFIRIKLLKSIADKVFENQEEEKYYEELITGAPQELEKYINKLCREINYRDHKEAIKHVLLIHNIQTVIDTWRRNYEDKKTPNSFARFPFFAFHDQKWDIEHINSQHEFEGKYSHKGLDLKTKLMLASIYESIPKNDETKQLLKDVLSGANKNINEEFKKRIKQIINVKDPQKDALGNLVLLDQHTNREYKNAPFAYKRMVVLARMRGEKPKSDKTVWDTDKEYLKIDENGYEGDNHKPMVPICTSNVFTKYYNSLPSDYTRWDEDDAKTYFKDIKEKMTHFFQSTSVKK